MNARDQLTALLAEIDVEVNGHRPWDIQVDNDDLFPRIVAEGSLGLGEAYMDGWWDSGQLDEFFNRVIGADLGAKLKVTPALAWLALTSHLQNRQNRKRAFQVADVHYNLGIDVF
ncbi:MAG TPA: hypothetical protein VGF50_00570, partial [Caulobacteraceae bacterium]